MMKSKDPNNPAPKAPPSEARQAASRANGAKSKGPVTPEGKARSSKNATTHGLLARSLTLCDGDAELFQTLQLSYIQRFTPRDQPEHDLIEEAAYCKWQMRQAWMMHARTLKMQIVADMEETGAKWDGIPLLDRQALALAKSLKDSNVLPNLERYARQLAAQSDRAIKLFMQLRAQTLPPVEPVVEPNEPEVMAQHYTSRPAEPAQPNEPETEPAAALTTDHRPLTTTEAAPLTTDHRPLTTTEAAALTTDHRPLTTTEAAPLTTDHRPLTTTEAAPLTTDHRPPTTDPPAVVLRE